MPVSSNYSIVQVQAIERAARLTVIRWETTRPGLSPFHNADICLAGKQESLLSSNMSGKLIFKATDASHFRLNKLVFGDACCKSVEAQAHCCQLGFDT